MPSTAAAGASEASEEAILSRVSTSAASVRGAASARSSKTFSAEDAVQAAAVASDERRRAR